MQDKEFKPQGKKFMPDEVIALEEQKHPPKKNKKLEKYVQ